MAMPESSIQVTNHLRHLIPAFTHASFIGLQERFLASLEMTIRGLISNDRHLTSILRPSGIAPFRHPERSKMPFVREVVFRKLGTEPKDLGEAATFIPNS